MTREFIGKVMLCGMIQTRRHMYMRIVEGLYAKVVREDGYVCAVYVEGV